MGNSWQIIGFSFSGKHILVVMEALFQAPTLYHSLPAGQNRDQNNVTEDSDEEASTRRSER